MIEKYLRPDTACSRPELEKRMFEANLLSKTLKKSEAAGKHISGH